MSVKFWNWVKNESSGRTLYLDGYIAQESWWDDDVTPKQFKAELDAGEGDITVWINSGGGDCLAASQIYTMLMEYKKKGMVNVKIDGIAASAASVVAMAGDFICMSPTANMMIHNPATIAWGERCNFEKAIDILNTIKDSIVNAYEIKTKMSRAKISQMMDEETWFDARKAVELGFADKILYTEGSEGALNARAGVIFNMRAVTNAFIDKFPAKESKPKQTSTPIADLDKRLALLKK